MPFQLGRKILIVNDAAQAALLFYARLASGIKRIVETDDDYNTATPYDQLATSPDTGPDAEGAGFLPATPATDETIGQADFLRILGFGDFEGSQIVNVIGAKAVPAVRQVATITLSALTVVAGQELIIDFAFKSDDLRGEFASHQSDYKKLKSLVIPIKTADTVTTVAVRVKEHLQAIIDSGWAPLLSATNAAGVLTLTSADGEVTFTATFSGTATVLPNITAVFATTVEGYAGRGTWDQIKALRLETVNGAYVAEFSAKQVAIKGAFYSSYVIKKTVVRPDLTGFGGGINSIPSGVFEFHILVNEALTGYIADLTKWLNANVANRTMYTSTTAAGVLGGDPSTVAVAVDAAEPLTLPLV